MTKLIEISNETYARLSKLAVGFDTPEAVINRLIDNAEGKPDQKPLLSFDPEDEALFKASLLESKEAEVVLYRSDDTREIRHWNASKLTEDSNLRGNLWSGMLRGWKEKQIVRAHLKVLPKFSGKGSAQAERDKRIAYELGLTFDELNSLDFKVSRNVSMNGVRYDTIIEFQLGSSREILDKIKGLQDSYWMPLNICN